MTQQQEQPSYDDLMGVIKRDRLIKDNLLSKIAALVGENTELWILVQELREQQAAHEIQHAGLVRSNGDPEASQSPPGAPESPAAGGAVSSVP